MNDLSDWIRENKRIVLALVVILVICSAVVGFIVGTIKRKSTMNVSPISEIEEAIESSAALSEKGRPQLIMPEPIIPHITEPFPEFSFYLENSDVELKDLKMLPVNLSDLLRYRGIGVSSDIEPFQFHNEEIDILTVKDELAEP